MFGLKPDWSWELTQRHFSLEDYTSNEPRWCPGCGDHAILTSVQRILRDEQLLPEEVVAVSGIGCASRFPHYLGTYGFHGLHGRALPVACGIKARRPELSVWVATGDGDCFSIGAAHWIHAVRYNMDMIVMIFDNAIYGLTKKQTSPTTPEGLATNTHPFGNPLPAHNPLTVTLGIANVSFVAQTVDWNVPHLHATLAAAYAHKGLSFVRIYQRCPAMNDNIFDDLQEDPSRMVLLTHEKGIPIDKGMERVFPVRREHDPSDMGQAQDLAGGSAGIPVGLLYYNPSQPLYEEFTTRGIGMLPEQKLEGLSSVLDRFSV
uniref:2-oxoglutarate ferredoxin oxidoreductase subunit beta n=1 Tax=Candidatus Kentrum sp. TUN TaxID=2126343 RepID=A0A450ZA57_9GAMM|nr:MAG: 2-oxoglutarate ferredoxin oxidoreductase subunit beta [Candidatus Kentron sp. TUN]VFK53272.1 MAG: 2-oxoglutarate ferredoxin oxidoreductase subunit beta [Candidatus Kentron sp. TUN]VFK54082.1 MAG: 2-oxoglutarate ferredoxin oxidoreductase subunit beta [Candidatus Kentron sp. TUN]